MWVFSRGFIISISHRSYALRFLVAWTLFPAFVGRCARVNGNFFRRLSINGRRFARFEIMAILPSISRTLDVLLALLIDKPLAPVAVRMRDCYTFSALDQNRWPLCGVSLACCRICDVVVATGHTVNVHSILLIFSDRNRVELCIEKAIRLIRAFERSVIEQFWIFAHETPQAGMIRARTVFVKPKVSVVFASGE